MHRFQRRPWSQHIALLMILALSSASFASAETSPPPAQSTAADALVRYLENEGVTKVFGVPGEETLHLVDAIRRSKRIEFVLTGNEQGATHMALGCYRATGRLGVALSTLGPGATNMITGAANALSENGKLLLITGQAERSRPDGYHQKMNLARLFAPVTRRSVEARDPERIVEQARTLVGIANQNPGPVMLSVPADVAKAQIVLPDSALRRAPRAHRDRPDHPSVAQAATLLEQAKFPVIIAGDGVLHDHPDLSARAVLAFAERHGIPIVPSTMARGYFPNAHPMVAPVLDAAATGAGGELLRKADLIINLGYHPTETFNPEKYNPRGQAAVIHVSPQPLPRHQRIAGMQPTVALHTSIGAALEALHRELGSFAAPAAALTASREVATAHNQELSREAHAAEKRGLLKPEQVLAEIRRGIDAYQNDPRATEPRGRLRVFADVGLNKGLMTHWFAVQRPGELFIPNGMSTMGVALSSAIGAKLVRPRDTVLSVSGDGGFAMNMQEVATAAEHRVPLVHVVLVDGDLGLIRNHQHRQGLPPFGIRLSKTNIPAVARSMGASGRYVTSSSHIAAAVKRGLEGGKPTVIAIPVDYSHLHNRVMPAAPPKAGE